MRLGGASTGDRLLRLRPVAARDAAGERQPCRHAIEDNLKDGVSVFINAEECR